MADRDRCRFEPRYRTGCWLALGVGAALLSGCASPYYSAYPVPVYVPPQSYVIQPAFQAPLPAPVPLYAMPRLRPEPVPTLEPPTTFGEPTPGLEATPEPEPSPAMPHAAAPAARPAVQAGPGTDTPLQGFRPMRGQALRPTSP